MPIAKNTVIGNTDLVTFLNNLTDRDKLPTAVLLVGPAMVGKTTILENIAKKIICTDGEKDICGQCSGCAIGVANHPDVLRLGASEEDSLRKEISSLLKRIHEKPVMAKKIIVFLENIDQFSWAASPLLLKALEDAPEFVVFFLTAESAEAVLPTIRSRCMTRYAGPVNSSLLKERLLDKNAVLVAHSQTSANDVDLTSQVVLSAGGRPGLALRLLDDGVLREKYDYWRKVLMNMANLPIGERAQFAETIDKTGEGKEVISLLQSLLRYQIFQEGTGNAVKNTSRKKILGTIRRSREAMAMFRANIPQRVVLEYVFFNQ